MKALLTIEKVADFAITQIAFSPEGNYLACSSPANEVSLVTLGKDPIQQGWPLEYYLIISAFIIMIIAVLYLFL